MTEGPLRTEKCDRKRLFEGDARGDYLFVDRPDRGGIQPVDGYDFIGNVIEQNVGISNNVPLAAAFAVVPIVIMGVYVALAKRLGAFEAI